VADDAFGCCLSVFYRSYGGWSRWTILLSFLAHKPHLRLGRKRIKWPPVRVVLCAIPLVDAGLMSWGRTAGYVQGVYCRAKDWPSYRIAPRHFAHRAIASENMTGRILRTSTFLTFVNRRWCRTGPAPSPMVSQYLQLFTEPIPRKALARKAGRRSGQLFQPE